MQLARKRWSRTGSSHRTSARADQAARASASAGSVGEAVRRKAAAAGSRSYTSHTRIRAPALTEKRGMTVEPGTLVRTQPTCNSVPRLVIVTSRASRAQEADGQ